MNLNTIKLDDLADNIFSEIAKEAADFISPIPNERGRTVDVNKSAQLRKFYDELVMWHDKELRVDDRAEAYRQAAPFIQMLKAKAAYSQGRGHIDKNFVDVLNKIISHIKSPETLKNAKLFFEAVLGFRKASEQK
mgnify:CR=1 FL=1